jgi:cob(I)alamin adenosyltransferase
MKIYTRRGDDGTTGLFYGGRIPKDGPGPEAYGTVDEAVAALGMARATADRDLAAEILRIQRQLFVVAAELATAPESRSKLEDEVSRVTPAMVERLEADIDRVVAEVGSPTEFVVPGGSSVAAAIDLARTIVRRAERRTVTLIGAESNEGGNVVPYLNRLADYLFVLARAAEQNWTPSRGGMS